LAHPTFAVSIAGTLEFISDRTRIVVLNLLAALGTLDPNMHKYVSIPAIFTSFFPRAILPAIQRDIFVFLSMSCSANAEVAAASFTCLNALVVSERHKIDLRDQIKKELLSKGFGRIARVRIFQIFFEDFLNNPNINNLNSRNGAVRR
jgi:hypothetical protein